MKKTKFLLGTILTMVSILWLLNSCKVNDSLEQFYAKVKLEYVLKDSTLNLIKVDVKKLEFNEEIMSIKKGYVPKADEEGYMRVTKGQYDIQISAEVIFVNQEGIEKKELYHNTNNRAFAISKDAILTIILEK